MTTPTVLVHGVGLDASMWDGVVAHMGGTHPIIAIDMAGHGMSRHPAAKELNGYVDALEHDISDTTDGTINLVGFSMGAMVAAAYALKRPENVSSIVMMNAIHQRDAASRRAVLDRLSVARKDGLAVIADAAISRWFSDTFVFENPDTIEAVRNRLIANDLESYLLAYKVFATADAMVAPSLDQITCPVLAVTSDGDGNSTPAMSHAIADSVREGRAVVWNGLAHGAPIEDPERVANTLIYFLNQGTMS